MVDESEVFDRMEKLEPKDVLILYLRSVKEMTYKEIGERVMLSHEGVRQRLIKIRRRLTRK